MAPKAQGTKINKLDFIKIENFHTSKDTINKVKTQCREWKDIFSDHMFDKDLVSRMYRTLIIQRKDDPV